jgi:hypothetical protein
VACDFMTTNMNGPRTTSLIGGRGKGNHINGLAQEPI